ncbi:hypothetical protein PMIN01_04719 [Paraphaeosphaeria minitans]|uniref:Defective in cullin neddylation protein n=1 Tax=Paraphaeosphaeria minitans TaxID=565426 RepID=A0A9P6GM65_9PLEO|nr:hypothetical protein PMIN01_04719 [Paraphaeosphaeria minitans]
MFGSSQDRARQLAGRHRRDRKTSGSSYLSSRSVSSSTQLSIQPQPQYPLLEQALGQCWTATQDTLRSGQHTRQVSQSTSPDMDTLPLPPNTLPTRSLLSQNQYLHHNSDLFDATATIHDISSLFKDLSTHSPVASTLHESADRFAERLRVLLVQERYQSEHLSTVLHGNPSEPNLVLQSPDRSSIDSSGPYPSPRRMTSQPSPLRASNGLAPAADATDNPGGSRPPAGRGRTDRTDRTNFFQNANGQERANSPYTLQYIPAPPLPSAVSYHSTSLVPSRPLVWDLTIPGHGYFHWHSWMIKSKDCSLWHEPITPYNNPGFAAIINNVPVHHVMVFERCFSGDPWGPVSDSLSATNRRNWFKALSDQQKEHFRHIIAFRAAEIQRSGLNARVQIERPSGVPAMMLHEALEAIEERYDARVTFHYAHSHQTQGALPTSNRAASLSKSSLNKLFDSLRDDKNSPDTVGPEGAMGYFEKLGVDLEGMDALAVMEVIQAPTMGELGREGFVEGWSSLNADTLDKQKAHLKSLKQRLPTDKAAFDKVYKYTFLLGRPAGAKAVPLDSALAFWELLFTSPLSAMRWSTPNSPWSEWWSEFLNSEWKKSVNKDMWNETLKFAKLTLEDEAMSFWDESSSWPSVIDDFVEWVKKEKRPSQNTVDEMEE